MATRPLLGGTMDRIDTDTLLELVRATRNAAFVEEYRKRNIAWYGLMGFKRVWDLTTDICERRLWDMGDDSCGVYAALMAEPCECWACERYGLGAYWDFYLHPDGDYPDKYLADGKCWCWVCSMAR